MEGMSPAPIRVRGLLVRSQRRAMEAMAGLDAVQRAIDALPPAERSAYEEASALSWVPQTAVRGVTRSVAGRLGLTGEQLAAKIVRASVREACSGPWNVLLRLSSDEALIARVASLFARAFDGGRIEATKVDEGVELVLRGWPDADRMDLVSLEVGVEATLSSVGRNASIETHRTPEGARMLVRMDAGGRSSVT